MNEIAIPTVTRLPAALTQPTARRGTSSPDTAAIASGSQIRIERVIYELETRK